MVDERGESPVLILDEAAITDLRLEPPTAPAPPDTKPPASRRLQCASAPRWPAWRPRRPSRCHEFPPPGPGSRYLANLGTWVSGDPGSIEGDRATARLSCREW